MSNNLEVALALKIAQTGLSNIRAVIDQLSDAGVETQEFQHQADELAKTMQTVAKQRGLIDQFKDLRQSTSDSKDAMAEAQRRAADLAIALQQTESPTKKQTQAFERARKVAKESAEAYQNNRLKLQGLRQEMSEAGINSRHLGTHHLELKKQTEALEQQQKSLATQLASASSEVQTAADNYTRARDRQLKLAQAAETSASAFNSAGQQLRETSQQYQLTGNNSQQLQTDIQKLAVEFDKAGSQQSLIANFLTLRQRTEDSRLELERAQNQTRNLALAMKETESPSLLQTQAFEKARQATRDASEAYQGNRQQLQSLRSELTSAGVNTKNLAHHQIDLKRQSESLETATEALYNEMEAGSRLAADRDLLGLKQHIDIQKEIDETRAAYKRLKDSGQLTSTELAQAALKTEDRIKELKHQTNGWTDSLENAKLSLAGLAAAGAGIVSIAGQTIEFESAMADVKKVVDGTPEQIEALASRIKELSTELPISADGLAQIAAAGGQLGIPLEKLETFIQLSAKMATAFNLTAEQAGEAVAKLSNVFNLPLESVESLGDAINTLGNTTAAKEADILEFLTRVGGTATQFGLTAEQASALGATLIGMGSSSEVAATGVNALLSKLQTANTQGADFQSALKGMGVSASELAAEIRANPQQALSEFLKQLDQLDQQSKAEILSKLFGQEYQDDIARLLNGLNQYESALNRISDAGQTAGAMNAEFATRMETTEEQIKLLKNGLETVAINLGTVFLPALREGVVLLGDAAGAVASFVENNPEIAATAAVIGTAMLSAAALKTSYLALSVVSTKTWTAMKANIASTNVTLKALTTQVGVTAAAMRTAAGVAGAAWIGWEIGKSLSEEFEIVQQMGIALAAGLTKLAARAEAAWEIITNPGDYEASLDDLDAKLQQIDETYAQMFAEVGKVTEQQKKVTEEVNNTGDAVDNTGEKTKTATGKVVDMAQAWLDLGLDADEAMGRATEGATKANNAVAAIESELEKTGTTAGQQSNILYKALAAAIPTAKTSADIELLKGRLTSLSESGRLSADAVALLTVQLQNQQGQIQQNTAGINSMEEALSRFGLQSQTALQQTADSLKQTLDYLQQNGATTEQLSAAFPQYAAAAIAANDGVVSSELRLHAARLGLTEQLDDLIAKQNQSGAAGKDAGDKSADGHKRATDAAKQATDATDQLATAARNSEQDVQAVAASLATWFDSVNQSMADLSAETSALFRSKLGADVQPVLDEIDSLKAGIQSARTELGNIQKDNLQVFDPTGINKWKNSVLQARDETVIAYNQQKIKFLEYTEALESGDTVTQGFINQAQNAIQNMSLLGSQNLATLRSALASAQSQLDQMSDSATDTLTSLREQLYNLQGDTEAYQQSQYNTQKAELEAALAEAKAANNTEAISAYQDALKTLNEIRKEQKAQAAETESTTTSSTSASSATTTATTQSVETVTVELAGRSVEVIADYKDDLLSMIEDAYERGAGL